MCADHESFFPPCPFWFASTELLTEILRAEIETVRQLLDTHPDFRNLLDAPEATIPQRTACFSLSVHRKLIEVIDETFITRYEQESPSLSEAESKTIRCTHNLVAADSPAWVLEMDQVIEQLPAHIQASLPESIRAGGYRHDNAEQLRAAELAVETLSNTEQIHTLTQRVINEQLQRLVRRWSAAVPSFPIQQPSKAKENRPKGFEGLSRKKIDLSRYLDDDLTEKQRTAFSLKHEYGLGLTEIASRMGIDRKTAYEHIQAAARQIDQARSGERRKANRAKISPEE